MGHLTKHLSCTLGLSADGSHYDLQISGHALFLVSNALDEKSKSFVSKSGCVICRKLNKGGEGGRKIKKIACCGRAHNT